MTDVLAVREVDVELVPAQITVDRSSVEAKVQALIEPYTDIADEVVDGMDEKEVKACRADLNRISKDLNDARKAIKRAYNEPLSEFEAWVKDLDAQIGAPLAIIADSLDRRDRMARRQRLANLNEAYIDFCEANGLMAMCENVDIERLIDPKWLNKSFGEKKAESMLIDKVSAIVSQHHTLNTCPLRFPEQTRAYFWECLNFEEAMKHDQQLYDQQQKAEAIQQEIQQNIEYQNAPNEEYVYEPYEPAEVPADYTPEPPQEKPCRYVISLRSPNFSITATPSEWERIKGFMQSQGIHGTVKEYPIDERDRQL